MEETIQHFEDKLLVYWAAPQEELLPTGIPNSDDILLNGTLAKVLYLLKFLHHILHYFAVQIYIYSFVPFLLPSFSSIIHIFPKKKKIFRLQTAHPIVNPSKKKTLLRPSDLKLRRAHSMNRVPGAEKKFRLQAKWRSEPSHPQLPP